MKRRATKGVSLLAALAMAMALSSGVPIGAAAPDVGIDCADEDDVAVPPIYVSVVDNFIDIATGETVADQKTDVQEYYSLYSKPVLAFDGWVAVAYMVDGLPTSFQPLMPGEIIVFPRMPGGAFGPYPQIEFVLGGSVTVTYFYKADLDGNGIPDDEEDGGPDGPKEVTAGIYNYYHTDVLRFIEDFGPTFRLFYVDALNFGDVGAIRMQVSYAEGDYECEIKLTEQFEDGADLMLFEVAPVADGYKTFNAYIIPNGGYLPVGDSSRALLEFVFTVEKAGIYAADAKLTALEVTYYDKDYMDGESPLQAIAKIDPASTSTVYALYSMFDLNDDGILTLLDVEIVRRNIGKSTDPDVNPDWLTARRSDLNSDGKVDIEDLLLILAKYESQL